MKSTQRMERFDEIPGGRPRAPRYWVQLRAYYRGAPAEAWHEATTINMSRTGVLFTTADAVSCGMSLEFRVEIDIGPAEAPVVATIDCQCRTIRVEPRRDAGIETARGGSATASASDSARASPGATVAARIERYAFRRGAPSFR